MCLRCLAPRCTLATIQSLWTSQSELGKDEYDCSRLIALQEHWMRETFKARHFNRQNVTTNQQGLFSAFLAKDTRPPLAIQDADPENAPTIEQALAISACIRILQNQAH